MTKPSAVLLPLSALVAGALLLGGCDRTTGIGVDSFTGTIGSSFGRPGDKAATAVSNAAMGGLIGSKIGALLDDEDRRLAYQAQIEALDNGSAGAPVPWRNPASGRFGNIVPGPAYANKGATCRGFSHTVTVAGQLEIARGTACRVQDGPWSAAGQ